MLVFCVIVEWNNVMYVKYSVRFGFSEWQVKVSKDLLDILGVERGRYIMRLSSLSICSWKKVKLELEFSFVDF